MEKLLATVTEGYQALGTGRSHFYKLIQAGKIETVKVGKRRLIVVESLRAYVASLRAAA